MKIVKNETMKKIKPAPEFPYRGLESKPSGGFRAFVLLCFLAWMVVWMLWILVA